ncbi:putative FBD-associated F-box protein At1g05080 [Capsella rubella]|uniref:putative FBD-associated F-box protein At1g05080 n=1 Tax=Capsella rubella TaxID=81985 RepID=UPI000CD5BB0E|nr:putative FBD-associated F-box protein At1g05080 [Capsella rubella]
MVPKLEYTIKYSDNIEDVCRFIDKSMELNKEPVLETFRIHLDNRELDTSMWIKKSVDRHVRVLELNLLSSKRLTKLPQSLYTCRTLVELTLSNRILVDVPSSAYLPSLKKLLVVSVRFRNQDSVFRLLSSCSNLAPSTIPLSMGNNLKDTFSTKKVQLPCMRVLELKLHKSKTLSKLPESLYTCETLVELTLANDILVDVPSSAYLPSLKKLLLVLVEYKDEDSLVRLLSSCSDLARSTIRLSIADNWKDSFSIKKFSVIAGCEFQWHYFPSASTFQDAYNF